MLKFRCKICENLPEKNVSSTAPILLRLYRPSLGFVRQSGRDIVRSAPRCLVDDDTPLVRAGSYLEFKQFHVSCCMFHVFPEATLLESTAGAFLPVGERPARRAHTL